MLIRLMVGAVFLSEGLQKFLFPGVRGAGRFKKSACRSRNSWKIWWADWKSSVAC